MLTGHDNREHSNIHSELSYSPSLKAAVQLILGDPAFVGEQQTPSFKFIRAARFLKANAPHVFQIREMRAVAKNSMDRWLWDLLEQEYRYLMRLPRVTNISHTLLNASPFLSSMHRLISGRHTAEGEQLRRDALPTTQSR
jgi:hypothetical protein